MSTRRFYVFGFAALMLTDTLTQISVKLSTRKSGELVMSLDWLMQVLAGPWIYFAVLGYLGSFITWMTLLKHAPVGPSFAASHLEVVSVLIISVLFFGERLSWLQVVGSLCIVAGILCLSRSEAAHSPA